jgi:YfiH family protein
VNAREERAPAHAPLTERFAACGIDWIVPQWPAPSSVHAFVTTRNGGVSTGPRASLDLGDAMGHGATAEETAAIAENRRRVGAFLPDAPHWLEQVHGADVRAVRARDATDAGPPRADAALTREPDVVLGVRIADCMPVFFADIGASVVAVAHAGWRGLAAGILENTVAAMRVTPSQVVAWLGPAIGKSAFEVGSDVFDAFTLHDEGARLAFEPLPSGKWLADLQALARMRLSRAGVASVHGEGDCTLADAARFYSYRRDRGTGRMGAFIWRAAPRP